MSGPITGNTNTKLIGTGYNPKNLQLSHKWGVYQTETINKNDIINYIYEENTYLNMIEGSEELSAYWFESSNFPKIDTIMKSGASYDTIYQQSSVLAGNYNTTYGGPMYIEVGNNVPIPV